MIYYFQILLTIYIALFVKTEAEHLHFGHTFITDVARNNFTFYVFEMTSLRHIQDCIDSCKSKKQCKIINYNHRAMLCYHVGSSLIVVNFNLEMYVEEKQEFSYGVKTEWNMTGYEQCEQCKEVGVCGQNEILPVPSCQNSGCRLPVHKSNAIYHGNMFSIGNKIEYECMAGYETNATFPLRSTCLSNGTWSSLDFECLPEVVFGSDVYEYENNFFFLSRVSQTWPEAREECASKKLSLVKVKSQQKQEFIKTIIPSYYDDRCYWTGGTRKGRDTFEWLDGEEIRTDGQLWHFGQPNNYGDDQDCLVLKFRYNTFKLSDKKCSRTCYAVCEYL